MVFLTKEQIIKRKREARFRFKTAVRKAFLNKKWLSELDEKIGEDVKKNVAIILNRSNKKVGITLLEKSILKTPVNKRTEEEVDIINKLFDKIPCFQIFMPIIRKKLANVVEFYFYPKGKKLYLEGQASQSMSFIISGEVVVTRLTFIKSDKEIIDEPVNLLGCAESFGEIGLLYNERRYASCTAQSE